MLQPHKSDLKFFLNNKLLNEFDFVKHYNWYSLKSLINIKEYRINFDNLEELDTFLAIKNNMI